MVGTPMRCHEDDNSKLPHQPHRELVIRVFSVPTSHLLFEFQDSHSFVRVSRPSLFWSSISFLLSGSVYSALLLSSRIMSSRHSLPSYTPLCDNTSDYHDDEAEKPAPHRITLQKPVRFNWGIVGLLIIILLLNMVLTWRNFTTGHECRSIAPFSDPATVVRPYHWASEFSNPNKSITSPLWEGLFPTGDGLVSLPDEWAASHGLPASAKRYKHTSNSIYLVAGYHQLHCLVIIRSVLYHLKEGAELAVPFAHAIHCLDTLRQSTICHADDTILYTSDFHTYGDGQSKMCKDWSALERWTLDNRIKIQGIDFE
ncbi:hypothetical protein F5Y14DRAFT_408800 [Nemania sp. NC0429]|nr:hypothetical protein F5Y14DRAFT_408800 [Nemania sp. NC0429]